MNNRESWTAVERPKNELPLLVVMVANVVVVVVVCDDDAATKQRAEASARAQSLRIRQHRAYEGFWDSVG
eukprot:10683201-Lingulodinium_polyedra.AAC.1